MKNNQNGSKQLSKSPENDRFSSVLTLLTKLAMVKKNYGKTPDEFGSYVDSFLTFIPNDVSTNDLCQAIITYAQLRPDMPDTSEIMNILNHGYPEPKDPHRDVKPTQTDIYDDVKNAL